MISNDLIIEGVKLTTSFLTLAAVLIKWWRDRVREHRAAVKERHKEALAHASRDRIENQLEVNTEVTMAIAKSHDIKVPPHLHDKFEKLLQRLHIKDHSDAETAPPQPGENEEQSQPGEQPQPEPRD